MPAKKDPRVDHYIEECEPFARVILKHLRKIIRSACPEGEETIKWGMPHLTYRGSLICGYSGFKQHCGLGFWEGRDVVGGSRTEGAGHFGKIQSIADLPSPAKLTSYVRKAMKLIEGRGEVKKKPPAKSTAAKAKKGSRRTPPDLLRSLRSEKKALATFEAFSPTCKREYIDWITGAKTEETRERRLEQAVEWMAEGKSRNWKYK